MVFNSVHRARTLGVVVLLAIVVLATGCDFGGDAVLPIGSWMDDFGGTYTIEASSITFNNGFGGGYSATVEYISDIRLNADDVSIAQNVAETDNPGFAVIRYTAVSGPDVGAIGSYNVFRWSDGSSGETRRMAQGYKNVGGDYPDNINGVFFSSGAASAGATTAEYFSYAGEYTRQ